MTPDAILEGSLIYDVRPKTAKLARKFVRRPETRMPSSPSWVTPNVAYT